MRLTQWKYWMLQSYKIHCAWWWQVYTEFFKNNGCINNPSGFLSLIELKVPKTGWFATKKRKHLKKDRHLQATSIAKIKRSYQLLYVIDNEQALWQNLQQIPAFLVWCTVVDCWHRNRKNFCKYSWLVVYWQAPKKYYQTTCFVFKLHFGFA